MKTRASAGASILPITIDQEKHKLRERMKERYSSEDFRSQLRSVRQAISSGRSLDEVQAQLGLDTLDKETYWNDLVYAMASSFVKPENMLIEWSIKQNVRYQMAANLYKMAEEKKDLNEIGKAIMIMSKIDENSLELQKALGLLKPIDLNDDKLGQGITHEDLLIAERRFNHIIEERIVSKLELQRDAVEPVTLDVLEGSEPRREAD